MKTLTYAALVAAWLVSTAAVGAGDSSRFSPWSDPVNLGSPANTLSFAEITPCISRDGLSLYYESNQSGNGDLYVSQRPTTLDTWGTPVNLGANINTNATEYWPTLSRDGHRLYFSILIDHDGDRNFDLYVSRRQNVKDAFGWELAVPSA